MNILKVVSIALIAGILAFVLKDNSKRFSALVAIFCGVGILSVTVLDISKALGFAKDLLGDYSDLLKGFKTVLKCIGIGYVSVFAAQTLTDIGEKGLSDKVILAGRICILVTGLSLISSFLESVRGILF